MGAYAVCCNISSEPKVVSVDANRNRCEKSIVERNVRITAPVIRLLKIVNIGASSAQDCVSKVWLAQNFLTKLPVSSSICYNSFT